MTEDPQTECLTTAQAELVQTSMMHAANEMAYQSVEPVPSSIAHLLLGTFSQSVGLDLAAILMKTNLHLHSWRKC